MSTIAVKKVKLGDNADTSKNFLIEVPAVADGTLTIKREDGTAVLSINSSGDVLAARPIGYIGGSVTQTGNNTSDVTLNSPSGSITMFGPLTANQDVVFTVFNSLVKGTSIVIPCLQLDALQVASVEADVSVNGAFRIRARNLTGNTLGAALKIGFVILNGGV